MAVFCIPKPIADRLSDALTGDMAMARVYNMTSSERRAFFAKYSDPQMGREINKGFEKAMASHQKNALMKWAEKSFNSSGKKSEGYKNVIGKIQKLESDGLLTPDNADAFLSDLVAEQLGATITVEEANAIAEKTKKLEDMAKLPLDEFGVQDDRYFQARKDLDDYIDSLNPSSIVQVVTSVAMRGNMLWSLKSAFLNVESNTVNAVMEAVGRRFEALAQGKIVGLSAGEISLATRYHKKVMRIYAKTGYDITRMYSLDDGRKTLGEERIKAAGKGIPRWFIRKVYQDFVFGGLMTAPDVAFASAHFVDSAMIKAGIIAKSEGLSGNLYHNRVRELFTEATSLEPKSEQGRVVRDKARSDAQSGTYTNDTEWSKFTLSLRSTINKATGDLRLGDLNIPFVKTVANITGLAVDYSGTLIPIEVSHRMIKGVQAYKRGDSRAFRDAFNHTFWRKATRAGIGLTMAAIFVSFIEPDDFIGEWPDNQNEQQLFRANKSVTNSIKFGNRYISTAYFGPLGAPITGMLYAKKYGKRKEEKVLNYALGTGLLISELPGFKQMRDFYESLVDNKPGQITPEELTDTAINTMVDFLKGRLIPAFTSDIAKAQDPVERQTDKEKPMDRVYASLPWTRQSLPVKRDVLGNVIESEGWASIIGFGSRVKTKSNDPILLEIERVGAEAGKLPTLTDIDKTANSNSSQLKAQIGKKKFEEAKQYYQKYFRKEMEYLMEDFDYIDATAEEKVDMINAVREEAIEDMLIEYDFENPEDYD